MSKTHGLFAWIIVHFPEKIRGKGSIFPLSSPFYIHLCKTKGDILIFARGSSAPEFIASSGVFPTIPCKTTGDWTGQMLIPKKEGEFILPLRTGAEMSI